MILGLALAACAEFPQVDAALAEGDPEADYPELLPFEQLLAGEEPQLSETDDAALLARAAELRNRANGLRGPVIDRDTRDRMDDGVTEP